MDAHPHPDRSFAECALSVGGSPHGAGRRLEGDEERVALGVHFDSALTGEGLAERPPVIRQGLRVRLRAEVVQQLRRALDVGEEEGDGAGGEINSHRQHDARGGTAV